MVKSANPNGLLMGYRQKLGNSAATAHDTFLCIQADKDVTGYNRDNNVRPLCGRSINSQACDLVHYYVSNETFL